MRSPRISIASGAALCLAGALAGLPAAAWAQGEPAPPRLSVKEPRAYGYQVGDTATRELIIDLPVHLRLDESSLPAIGRHGPALELRSLRRAAEAGVNGTRLTLRLEYQVFAAPLAVRVYELPALRLRLDGAPRAETLFVEAWPMAVAPLVPEQPSPRSGLGELQADTAPELRDTRPQRALLAACAALAASLGVYLSLVYFGVPWLAGQRRPFTRAYRLLRRGRAAPASPQTWQDACRTLHGAFNETAGQVVFADTVDGFLGRAPRFAPLGEDIRSFFARSQAGFFEGRAAGSGAAVAGERDWLLAFARACRNAERGTA